QAKAEAGPTPKPNTQAPKTVQLDEDGNPIEQDSTWTDLSHAAVSGEFTRPATPLSGTRENPYASGEAIERQPGLTPADAAKAVSGPKPAKAPVIPWEDRLDAY